MRKPRTRLMFCRSFLLVGLLLLVSVFASGQISKQFQTTVQIPEGGGAYVVAFTYTVRSSLVEKALPDGTVQLSKPGTTFIKLNSIRINGPDAEVSKKIGVEVEFLGANPETIDLTSGGGKHKIKVTATGKLPVNVRIFVKYGGNQLKMVPYDLGRNFIIAAEKPAPAVTEPPPVKPGPTPVTLPETNNPGEIKSVEPPPPPPYESDYDKLSPIEYVDKWPGKSPWVEKALAKIPLEYRLNELEPNLYQLDFDYVRALRLDAVTGGTGYTIVGNIETEDYGHRLMVRILDAASYQLHLSDTTKASGPVTVVLDNLLGGDFTLVNDSLKLRLEGGVPPYKLFLLQEGRDVGDIDIGTDTVWETSLADLRQRVGRSGTFTLRLTDDQRTARWDFSGKTIDIPVEVRVPENPWLPWAAGGGVVLLGLILLVRSRRRRTRRRRIEENLSGAANTAPVTSTAPAAAPENAAVAKEEHASKKPAVAAVPPVSGGMRIKRRAAIDYASRAFNPEERPRDFLPLEPSRNWEKSLVTCIYFGKSAIYELDDFLRKENTSKIRAAGQLPDGTQWERNEAIPEIGGMLLGQFKAGDDGASYRVSVENFVPLEAREQNVVRVEIDPLSLARDLSRAQDDHPDLTVVGWFHTHPGHGLFLSQPDLKVQYGHFRQPYQFAMEIDSLTENLDTAFFTYQAPGEMNNRNTRRPSTRWFSWQEIEKFTRRNHHS